MTKLRIGVEYPGAPGFSMPLEAQTQTFAILAKRGVGKTYTGLDMVEEMLKAGLHVVTIDPVGVHWGLRSSADGKGPGLPITIFGGEHADVPLTADAGEIVADVIIDEKVSAVLDLSLLRKGEQKRFVRAFAERLYHRNREALHLLIDEADAFAPQRCAAGDEPLLGAIEDLVRRGRARGIGVTLITQRPAVLNKNVLTQIEVLIALRVVSPQDRKALEAWVEEHGDRERAQLMLSQLSSLPIGMAWLWSPGWLDVFERVAMRRRETFDSSATPVAGATSVRPRVFADVDLAAIEKKISATIERARADDPKALRARIAELETEIRKSTDLSKKVQENTVPAEPELVAAFSERDHQQLDIVRALLEKATHRYTFIAERLGTARANEEKELAEIYRRLDDIVAAVQGRAPDREVTPVVHAPARKPPAYTVDTRQPVEPGGKPLKAGARRMLVVLARNVGRLTKQQLATLADVNRASGTFSDYLAQLRSAGYITDEAIWVQLEPAGARAVGEEIRREHLSADEIVAMFRPKLKAGAQRMLDLLVAAYPKALSKAELAERAAVNRQSGTFSDYLASLRKNGLIEDNARDVQASRTLFLS